MARAGRPATGPGLADGLEGSVLARRRTKAILSTVSGELTIEEAGARLGIGRTRFFDLRREALQDLCRRMEPKPIGRPRRDRRSGECRALEKRIEELERERDRALVRAEVAEGRLAVWRQGTSPRGGLPIAEARGRRGGGGSRRRS